MNALAKRQKAQTARETDAELGRRARAKLAALRADLKAAKAGRVVKLREVGTNCRVQRKAVSARAKAARARLNASIARTRQRAQSMCSSARGEAYSTTLDAIERTARELQTELGEQRRMRIWATPQKKGPAIRGTRGKERAGEADDAVAAEIDDPGLRIVWEAVKHKIKPSGRRSRAEAFFEWAAEHTAQVYEIQERDAVRAIERLEREERQLAGALRKGGRSLRHAMLEAVPF
jgi:hypothetical protein